MSSLIPWVGGRPGWNPISDDLWDPSGAGGRGGWLWDGNDRRGRDETAALAQANVDWKETDKAHIFTAELPGVRKEDLKVEVEDGNILKISGEKIKEEENKTDTWHRIERWRGKFMRRFRLPMNANMEEVKCTLENGVLNVLVPKKETEQKPRDVKSIDIA